MKPVQLTSPQNADSLPPERTLVVLCGLAWLGVACAFSFLDRGAGDFGALSALWIVLGFCGFGVAVVFRDRPKAARTATRVLTGLAILLTLVPGFFWYRLVRWMAFGLLLVTAARAASMQSRRELYYALTGIVAVSLLVVTHHNAQWTVWFYLGPAWICIALLLAWDYAARVKIGAVTKAGFAAAFFCVSMAIGFALSSALPLPKTDSVGFMEPGTNNPGAVRASGGAATEKPSGRDAKGAPDGYRGARTSWIGDIVVKVHDARADSALPRWQRSVVDAMLAAAEAAARGLGVRDERVESLPLTREEVEAAARRAAMVVGALASLLMLLVAAAIGYVLWRLRWRIGSEAAVAAGGMLQVVAPAASMRCSLFALRCLLEQCGHPLRPGMALLEHVRSAAVLPALAHSWAVRAVQTYGAWRFGNARATRAMAVDVLRAVVVSSEAIRR